MTPTRHTSHTNRVSHANEAPVPWIPPAETEQFLHEATLRGDARAQLAALAGAELYIPAPRAEADAKPDTITWRAHRDPSGFVCRPVLTRGMLPAWHPDWVFSRCAGWPSSTGPRRGCSWA